MANIKFCRPKQGECLLMPDRGYRAMPAKGANVDLEIPYYATALKEGSMVEVEDQVETENGEGEDAGTLDVTEPETAKPAKKSSSKTADKTETKK